MSRDSWVFDVLFKLDLLPLVEGGDFVGLSCFSSTELVFSSKCISSTSRAWRRVFRAEESITSPEGAFFPDLESRALRRVFRAGESTALTEGAFSPDLERRAWRRVFRAGESTVLEEGFRSSPGLERRAWRRVFRAGESTTLEAMGLFPDFDPERRAWRRVLRAGESTKELSILDLGELVAL